MTFRLLSAWDGYAFAAGSFDVRGWEVAARQEDAPLGRVHDVVLDESGEPRYLDVRLASGSCVLLPIGQARVAEERDLVLLPGLERQRLEALPRFHDDVAQLTPEYERELCSVLDGEAGSDPGEPPVDADSVARLTPLSQANELQVARGEADPRGWPLLFGGGVETGIVVDLLIEREAMKARYLVCELSTGERVLIPVTYARLDVEEERVVVDAIAAGDAAALPAFSGLPLEPGVAARLHAAFTGGLSRGERHRHPRFSAGHFYGPRRRLGAPQD